MDQSAASEAPTATTPAQRPNAPPPVPSRAMKPIVRTDSTKQGLNAAPTTGARPSPLLHSASSPVLTESSTSTSASASTPASTSAAASSSSSRHVSRNSTHSSASASKPSRRSRSHSPSSASREQNLTGAASDSWWTYLASGIVQILCLPLFMVLWLAEKCGMYTPSVESRSRTPTKSKTRSRERGSSSRWSRWFGCGSSAFSSRGQLRFNRFCRYIFSWCYVESNTPLTRKHIIRSLLQAMLPSQSSLPRWLATILLIPLTGDSGRTVPLPQCRSRIFRSASENDAEANLIQSIIDSNADEKTNHRAKDPPAGGLMQSATHSPLGMSQRTASFTPTDGKAKHAKLNQKIAAFDASARSSHDYELVELLGDDPSDDAQSTSELSESDIEAGVSGVRGGAYFDVNSHPAHHPDDYPVNAVRNQKYRPLTFLFVVLYEQFKFFFNLYFLLVAMTQFIPSLQIGFLFTYLAPLMFVLTVTISKEAYDDFKRYQRDKEANSQLYECISRDGFHLKPSASLRVGDLVIVHTNQRIPADLILLRTTEKSGASFIRTDQLDGETDWKLRYAVASCQKLSRDEDLLNLDAAAAVEKPTKEIYNFVGTFARFSKKDKKYVTESLNLENTLWANTVLASGHIVGMVIYTGSETRTAMNTSMPGTKVGLLDQELNQISKVLFCVTVALALTLISMKGFDGDWHIYLFRFILLFSSIIPISLRVNLDMGKTVYSSMIMNDKSIPNTIVRTSTIPEELGRISYLLSDKTGTLTRNEMIFKRLHVGSTLFSSNELADVASNFSNSYSEREHGSLLRYSTPSRVRNAIYAMALCHSVTPVYEGVEPSDGEGHLPAQQGDAKVFHACSPDEIALVKFAESVGLSLDQRSTSEIHLRNPFGEIEGYEILNVFPFTSETKRMGIILREHKTKRIVFYMKGADAVMTPLVDESDWLEEECGNMARNGLRTLVFGKKYLSDDEYLRFLARYNQAKSMLDGRATHVRAVIDSIENDLELVCLTGVEDQLQENVKSTLEMLRNAGIKIWMLTGDKVETATCIAISSKLIGRTQTIYTITATAHEQAREQLATFSRKSGACLVIDGASLTLCLQYFKDTFIELACKAPSVVCCRCSPTQKADIVRLLRVYTQKRTCAIGDGGNDVSMIQAADVGVGIVGKEGKQASLAADFSITQFSFICELLLWHGRNSYKRSARLSQFVIHRGLIISIIQAVFTSLYYFAAVAIYNGWIMVGYATFYTMAPVFSLVLDEDVGRHIVFMYPELYKDLQKVVIIITFYR
eukprot:TRINITY_DN3778_c0_g2_i9.p1 TRINITY_DN3778_c0_g2~~TRINITY_DN3778_c0_g2_i9.p1  ORF type:complete len:1276 (+),score=258.10 TRINITY_DN3778_c0_g2_i9:70-3897(+)